MEAALVCPVLVWLLLTLPPAMPLRLAVCVGRWVEVALVCPVLVWLLLTLPPAV